jgi:hypothetical protein
MSSIRDLMKMFDIDREAAIEIQSIVREQQRQDEEPEDVLQFLPPSYGSSMSSTSSSFGGGSRRYIGGGGPRGNGFNFLKKVMPWPFMFIK